MRRALAVALLLSGCTSTSPSPTDSTPTQEPSAKVEPAGDGEHAPPPETAPLVKPTPSDPPPDVDPRALEV